MNLKQNTMYKYSLETLRHDLLLPLLNALIYDLVISWIVLIIRATIKKSHLNFSLMSLVNALLQPVEN